MRKSDLAVLQTKLRQLVVGLRQFTYSKFGFRLLHGQCHFFNNNSFPLYASDKIEMRDLLENSCNASIIQSTTLEEIKPPVGRRGGR